MTRKCACAQWQFQCLQTILLCAESLLDSDWLRTLRRYQHLQESRRITNGSGDCDEWFGQWRMFLRQCFETRTDFVEVIDFAQDRLKRHRGHCSLAETPKGDNFRWTGLGQRPERGEGGNHPAATITRQNEPCLSWSTLDCDRLVAVALWGSGGNKTRNVRPKTILAELVKEIAKPRVTE